MRALTESESMLKNKTLWFSISFIGGFQLIMDVDTIHVIIIFFDDGGTQHFQKFFLVALYWLIWWFHAIRQQHHDLRELSSKCDSYLHSSYLHARKLLSSRLKVFSLLTKKHEPVALLSFVSYLFELSSSTFWFQKLNSYK